MYIYAYRMWNSFPSRKFDSSFTFSSFTFSSFLFLITKKFAVNLLEWDEKMITWRWSSNKLPRELIKVSIKMTRYDFVPYQIMNFLLESKYLENLSQCDTRVYRQLFLQNYHRQKRIKYELVANESGFVNLTLICLMRDSTLAPSPSNFKFCGRFWYFSLPSISKIFSV